MFFFEFVYNEFSISVLEYYQSNIRLLFTRIYPLVIIISVTEMV